MAHVTPTALRLTLQKCVCVCLPQLLAYLAAIRLVNHEDFAPDLDSSGLSLAAPPPGETCQRFLVASHPRVILEELEEEVS